ncbi:MAG: hypothetical protein VX589_16435 [Myxococcota bacterium]|nr:hypothetical protein [Myxococcota bacterium]
MRCLPGIIALVLSVGMVPALRAEQPIFDEMPRWSGGWGFQILEEYRRHADFLAGSKVVGPGATEEIHLLHVQGVYTWKKWIRATAKLPVVLYAERERVLPDGARRRESDRGLGDLTLALPLKKYFNLDGRSGSWGLTPNLRVPLSGVDEYEVFDRRWGTGLGVSYVTETHRYMFDAGLTAWAVFEGPPNEVFATISLGLNFDLLGIHGHVKLRNTLRYQDDDSLTYRAGPVMHIACTDTIHLQLMWLRDYYDRQGTPRPGNGDRFRLGVGFVY